mmetsp:Transcript_28375/g.45975  ORF Transcript_28375/g.45975 Transcript_28375/m.45975 type:complete len:212 (+) Transcript_28375:255-890(+)
MTASSRNIASNLSSDRIVPDVCEACPVCSYSPPSPCSVAIRSSRSSPECIGVAGSSEYVPIFAVNTDKLSPSSPLSIGTLHERLLLDVYPEGYTRVRSMGRQLRLSPAAVRNWYREQIAKERLCRMISLQRRQMKRLERENARLRREIAAALTCPECVEEARPIIEGSLDRGPNFVHGDALTRLCSSTHANVNLDNPLATSSNQPTVKCQT